MRTKPNPSRNKSDWVIYTIGDVEASRQEAARAAQAARTATWIKWRWFDLLYTLLLGYLLLSHHPPYRLLLDRAHWLHTLLFCSFAARCVVSWRLWLLSKYPGGVTLAVRPWGRTGSAPFVSPPETGDGRTWPPAPKRP